MAASDADLLHPVGDGDADRPVQQLSVDQLPDRICRNDYRIDFLFYPVPVWTAREIMVILTVVFLALAFGISFLAVRVAMKKVEGSYYDK